MHIGRTLPPAAVPFSWTDILNGLKGWRRGATEVERFRSELCRHFNVRYCFLVSSGKAALFLILKALRQLRPHCDTVLIPAFNCYSVPSAIVRAGLKVGLCDVAVDTLDFDLRQLNCMLSLPNGDPGLQKKPQCTGEAAGNAVMEDRLLAILPTHLFGMAAHTDKVRELIAGRPIALVEDAAQAFGAQVNGRFLGCNGDIGFFSLGRGKAFSTVEGGVIVTDRPELAQKLEALIADLPHKNIKGKLRLLAYALALAVFLHPSCFWLPQGLPFLRLGETVYDPNFPVSTFTAFQAGLARGWLTRYRHIRQIRSKKTKAWLRCLDELDDARIKLFQRSNISGNLIRFPLRVPRERRSDILQDPRARRLGVMPSYPDSIDGIFARMGRLSAPSCPEAHGIARELITLPLHPYVKSSDRRKTLKLLWSHLSV